MLHGLLQIMSKTTINSSESQKTTHNFISKELPVTKDVYGVSRTVFTHVSNLHGLLNDWLRIQDKGTKLCRSMTAFKLHEYTDAYFPQGLKPLTEGLVNVLESLLHIVEGVETINKQLQALAKLQPTEQAIILSWSATRISETVSSICDSLRKEYSLKEVVAENIAHCRDPDLMEVYVSSWDMNVYFEVQSDTSYLFAEVGLSGIR